MTDKQQLDAGAKLVFGASGLNNPTPVWATYGFRIVSLMVGLWAIVQHLPTGLNEQMISNLNAWAVALLPITHLISKSFGWQLPKDNNTQ